MQVIKQESNIRRLRPLCFLKNFFILTLIFKLFAMIVYVVINGIITVKQWAINPNA
jgi:hypothetical protein